MSSLLKILFIGFAVTLHLDTLAQTEAIPFVHEKISVLPSGKKVAVTFKERACKSDECREVDAGIWGMDGGIPRFVTEVFIVSIDGNKFVVPEKFYKDFTNTNRLNIFEQKSRVVIELKGGEGAGAYTAHFMLGGMCGSSAMSAARSATKSGSVPRGTTRLPTKQTRNARVEFSDSRSLAKENA